MRRILTRALLPVLAVVLVVGVLAAVVAVRGSGTDITRARLERSLPATFSNIYVQQAKLLGHDGVTPSSLHAQAMCDRGGAVVADSGPGGDWNCLMGWTDPAVAMPPEGYGKFELNVHSNGCYTAAGPSKLTGFLTMTDKNGRQVPNPAFEFDGCLDPESSNAPTGITYPSVLNVASPSVTPDASGHVTVQLTCGTGAAGCKGTVTVMAGNTSLGTVPVSMIEEASKVITMPKPLPADATAVDVVLVRTVGSGSNGPVTVPVIR
jgi:hypothetical protein